MSKNQQHKYAVHEGRNPGTYNSWSEAKAQVEGYPSNCHEKVAPSGQPFADKHYVVYDGKNTGVYDSWKNAHAQVTGHPGSSFERVKSHDEGYSKFQGYSSSQGSQKKY